MKKWGLICLILGVLCLCGYLYQVFTTSNRVAIVALLLFSLTLDSVGVYLLLFKRRRHQSDD